MFIDDSKDFLLNFTLQLDERIAYKLYTSPFEALDAIHAAHRSEHMNQHCLSEYLESSGCPINNVTVNLDLAAVHWEVFNPQRFGEISVVVVDYAMPGMTGLEFCRKMENSPVKRILLTGRADEKLAVEAFNDGIIDMYVQKHNPDVTTLINESIANMQVRYFQNMSEIIVRMLSVHAPTCLQDPVFAELFHQIKEENNIVEFYLLENSGSYLMLDQFANVSYLIVKTEQDLKMHYELALDNKASQQILDQLQAGKSIPYFFNNHNFPSEWNDWSTYLYPAEKLVGKQNYYYSYAKNPAFSQIKSDKLVSYNTYLDQFDAGNFA